MKIYIVVAETYGTDGEHHAEVYPCVSAQEAGESATELIAEMCDTMGVEDIDASSTWTIDKEYWWFNVRVEEHIIPCDCE